MRALTASTSEAALTTAARAAASPHSTGRSSCAAWRPSTSPPARMAGAGAGAVKQWPAWRRWVRQPPSDAATPRGAAVSICALVIEQAGDVVRRRRQACSRMPRRTPAEQVFDHRQHRPDSGHTRHLACALRPCRLAHAHVARTTPLPSRGAELTFPFHRRRGGQVQRGLSAATGTAPMARLGGAADKRFSVRRHQLRSPLIIIASAIATFIPFVAIAGGSMGMSELLPILKQDPAFFTDLTANYSLPESAYAEVRLGGHFKHLGGARLGPYTFLVQQLPPRPAIARQVLLCTTAQFVSTRGQVLPEPQWELATQIREKLVSASFQEPNAPAVCEQ